VFTGFIDVPRTGVYTFQTASDDGSRLSIDGEPVIDNDGIHGRRSVSGQLALARGLHRIRLDFLQQEGDAGLTVRYAGPDIEAQPIPSSTLYRSVK